MRADCVYRYVQIILKRWFLMAFYQALFSGSSGNSSIVSENNEHLLIDLGKNCKQVCLALENAQIDINNIKGVLITHEHDDHISALKVFNKKHKIPIYARAKTLNYLIEKGYIQNDTKTIEIDDEPIKISNFIVKSFLTPHDSICCCGYNITTQNNSKISIATDIGEVTKEVYLNLVNTNLVVLEANYDKSMLMLGPYPFLLKKRVRSNIGHLSNDACARTISKLIKDGCSKFALCHLSGENNFPVVALDTVTHKIIEDNVCTLKNIIDGDIILKTNNRNSISEPINF